MRTQSKSFTRSSLNLFRDYVKTLKKPLMIGLYGLAVSVTLSGCSHLRFPAAFKIDIAQGNILEEEKVNQLQPGMNQRQVVYLLGSPLMENTFEPDVWEYVYQFSHAGGVPKRYRITLHFEGDVLKVIKGDIDKIRAWHKETNA